MEKLNLKDTASQVLGTINRVYYSGLTTTSGGNISAIDKNGHIFITPSGIDKGSLTPQDIAEVTPAGDKIGRYAPSMELPFHSNIYKMRKDIKGIVHAHAPSVVAYATAHKLPDAAVARCYFDMLGKVSGSCYDIPGSLGLGDIVKTEFEKGYRTVMMDNHGATVGGTDLTHAFALYENLEFLCEALIGAEMLGAVNKPTAPVATKAVSYPQCTIAETDETRAARAEMLQFIQRSYRNKLVSASFGVMATRLSDGSVLYLPDDVDRGTIEAKDFALIKDGSTTSTTASVYLPLILTIFDQKPAVNAVFISMPSATMSFAISGTALDSKLIPESYIMLKDVQTLPYGSVMDNLEGVANALSPAHPVALVWNECAVTIGKNMTKAFDRMEVLDYSARSIIKAKSIAQIVPINAEQVADIDRTFNGW